MRKIKNRKPAAHSRAARFLAAAFGFAMMALLVWVVPAAAEHTRFWRQSNFDEFDSGTAHGVAIRSDGRIVLAPKFTQFVDPNLAYLWSLRVDSKGNLYAAGGTNAKVLKIDPAGKMTTAFESEELTAQAVTLDKNDNLYVATSPDGKVYKVTPNGQKSVFFDPKMKYIWDLALGADGTVYVATGDTGKIFSVTPDGKGSEFYTSSETHIRALALDGKGNLLAGTEPDGLVLRIPLAAGPASAAPKRDNAKANAAKQDPPAADANASGNVRNAFVIYETAKKEITALLPDNSGNLYVGAIGEKTRGNQTLVFPQAQQQNPAQAAPAAQPGQTATITITAGAPGQPQASPFLPFPNLMSSSVYRIAPDGSPEEVWTSRENSVYALGFGADGKLLMGVGNEGSVMQLDQNRVFSRLAKTASEQVTGFARAANGKVYVATSNPANVFTLGPDLETEGSLESQTFDAKMFSHWGHVTWWGQSASGSDSGVELYVRAGNTSDPADSWSQWSGPYHDPKGEQIQSPAARFVQWKAVLKGAKTPPEISWVDIGYLPKNAAPYIEAIAIQDPGVKLNSFGQAGQAGTPQVQVHMPPAAGQNQQRQAGETPRFEAPPQGAAQKGWQSVIWSATDPNDDEMTYSIYYHGEKDKDWKLLKDKIEQKFYSWDTSSMPDGAYYLKIVASDERSNPPSDALKAERESDRFVVDNTPPSITGLAAEPQAAGATVRFRATDPVSAIVNAQYSVDAGDWTLLHPVGDVADSPDQRFEFTLRNLAAGEHTIAVRANDQFENLAAEQVTFTVPVAKK